MNSENKDTSSIILVRILHVVACIIVFFFGVCFIDKYLTPYHGEGEDDAGIRAMCILIWMAIQFVIVLFGLITINVVVHKKSGRLIIPSVLLLFCTSLFWFLDEKELGISFVCMVTFCGVISFLCDRMIERLKKKLDIK
ncbi:MAG: hypothetical protein J6Y11_00580 [Paludibacteraceae bacterium]|nr:hypothetical protein [Paludibacteraceae bacterium]